MQLKASIPVWLRAPRSTLWLVLAAVLLAVIFLTVPSGQAVPPPHQVAIYKAALIAMAAVLGYWLDRALFPYARPDGFLRRDWRYGTDEPENDVDFPVVLPYARIYCAAMLRRAIVVAAVVVGVAVGL